MIQMRLMPVGSSWVLQYRGYSPDWWNIETWDTQPTKEQVETVRTKVEQGIALGYMFCQDERRNLQPKMDPLCVEELYLSQKWKMDEDDSI